MNPRLGRFAAAALVALALVLTSAPQAATLRIAGTAPTQDNAGSCTAPVLEPMPGGNQVRVVVTVFGPVAFVDSAVVAAGAPFAFTRSVPSGTYTVRAWAADAGGVGCDTTLTVTVKNPPARVRL